MTACPATAAPPRDLIRVLLVDNHDSYTHNLCHRLLAATGDWVDEIHVIPNDAMPWGDLCARMDDFDAVVISPGPGVPSNPADFGLCAEIIRWATAHDFGNAPADAMPLLGVCLGHQGLAWALGGKVVRAPRVAHGVVESIGHCASGLFYDVPLPTPVVRYHSWMVERATLPSCLCVSAWTIPADSVTTTTPSSSSNPQDQTTAIVRSGDDLGSDSLIMAIAHRHRPLFGVQFHPESICTRDGDAILANFVRIARGYGVRRRDRRRHTSLVPGAPIAGHIFRRSAGLPRELAPSDSLPRFPKRAVWRRLSCAVPPRDAAEAFYALTGSAPRRFWLDSSRSDSPDDGRFSYMGVCATEGLAAIACDLALGQMTEWHALAGAITSQTVTMPSDGFMAYMERCLQSRRCAPDPTLPCGLCGGGLVGYLGYEMRRECGLSDALSSVPPSRASEPDAAFLVVDRYVAIDHVTNMVYGVALVDNAGTDDGDSAGAWFAHTEQTLAFVAERAAKHSASQSSASLSWTGTTAKLAAPGVTFSLDRGRERYVRDIASCLGEIADGESYELCLTNKARASAGAICDAWAYYLRLRSTNPAPYAAFVTFGRGLPVVASSSPEKFISIDREGRARSKPIKGTAPRGATPAEDRALAADLAACPKTFAENLMIVDLVRNDLSVCCVPGSVGVPSGRLMAIESYAAVHQMVTTVDGLLESGTTALDAVRAAFPPGSMTGAPKKRSVDILDRLEEGRPRGIYSGALGYFSADGACCLSVVIRTAVIDDGGSASIGCGGAIVADSEPDAEFSEILLKADRLVRAAGATEPIQVDTRPERVLVETMRLDPECALVEEHIARAIQSAEALGSRTLTPDAVRDGIRKEVHNNLGTANATPVRLRISIDLDTGCVTSTATALAVGPRWHTPNDALRAGVGDRVARVAFSSPVDSADVRLAHKTAARVVYDRAHQQTWSVDDDNNNVPSDARETLLINEKGHVTEATRASIALVPTDGSLPVTPPLDDGVLPGVMRARLLARGLIREGVITLDDLAVAAAAGRPLLLFNAVRGVYAVRI